MRQLPISAEVEDCDRLPRRNREKPSTAAPPDTFGSGATRRSSGRAHETIAGRLTGTSTTRSNTCNSSCANPAAKLLVNLDTGVGVPKPDSQRVALLLVLP